MADPVRESLKQVDADSWLIGTRSILKKTSTAATAGHLWESSDGSFYSICDAPTPPPQASVLSPDSPFRKVHDAGDAAAAWDLGDAFLKVKSVQDTRGVTEEHTTLDWLAKQELSFDVPKVLYHAEHEGRRYLIVSRLPGETINQVWRDLDDDERHRYAKRVVEIIQELSKWRSNKITGVDGKFLADSWLDPRRGNHDYSPETLQRNCEEVEMDCSMFSFCHNDFGPTNVIVDRCKQTIALIDWEMAGYVPKTWPRTKAGASWALDLTSYTAEDYPDYAVLEEKEKEWRLLVEKTLGEAGFSEVIDVYRPWMYKRLE